MINVQGDQPFIDHAVITAAAAARTQRDPSSAVITPMYCLQGEYIHNPAVLKSILAADRHALYFFRSAIPNGRDIDSAHWHAYATYWGHVVPYSYRADVLAQ
jgi:3-deoxy-manno-octulosonate cytidylyltransferase (CMP-KDO synthetase)